MIYVAFALAAVGVAGLALAPTLELALLSLMPIGFSAGAFLVVDWALLTDIIPKASSGRYMGISNVATASSGPVGLALAGVVLFLVTRAGLPSPDCARSRIDLARRGAASGDRVDADLRCHRGLGAAQGRRDAPRGLTLSAPPAFLEVTRSMVISPSVSRSFRTTTDWKPSAAMSTSAAAMRSVWSATTLDATTRSGRDALRSR